MRMETFYTHPLLSTDAWKCERRTLVYEMKDIESSCHAGISYSKPVQNCYEISFDMEVSQKEGYTQIIEVDHFTIEIHGLASWGSPISRNLHGYPSAMASRLRCAPWESLKRSEARNVTSSDHLLETQTKEVVPRNFCNGILSVLNHEII